MDFWQAIVKSFVVQWSAKITGPQPQLKPLNSAFRLLRLEIPELHQSLCWKEKTKR